MNVCSGNTTLTNSGTLKNTLNSGKPEKTQLVQLWLPAKYDFEGSKNFFIINMILKIYNNFDIIFI